MVCNYLSISNFNSAAVEVWEWISNFIPHFSGHLIIYPCQTIQNPVWELGVMCVGVYRCLHQIAEPFPRWLHCYLPSWLASCTYGRRKNGLGFYFYEERAMICVKMYILFTVFITLGPFRLSLSICLYVCPSVRLSHLFDYVPIIVSSWNFQELSHWTRVRSMQKVKVRGQRPRSQRSRPKFSFPDCNSSVNSHMIMKWYI